MAIGSWGFAFWMGVPGVFKVLAERSANPADRAGDAQTVMAAGQVVGPLIGGVTLKNCGSTALGIVGGATMAVAGLVVFGLRPTVRPRAPGPVLPDDGGARGPVDGNGGETDPVDSPFRRGDTRAVTAPMSTTMIYLIAGLAFVGSWLVKRWLAFARRGGRGVI